MFEAAGLAAFAENLGELRERTPSHDRARILGAAVADVKLDGDLRLPK